MMTPVIKRFVGFFGGAKKKMWGKLSNVNRE